MASARNGLSDALSGGTAGSGGSQRNCAPAGSGRNSAAAHDYPLLDLPNFGEASASSSSGRGNVEFSAAFGENPFQGDSSGSGGGGNGEFPAGVSENPFRDPFGDNFTGNDDQNGATLHGDKSWNPFA